MSWFSLSKEKAQGLLLKGVLENNLKKIDKALKAGADINYSYSVEELLQETDPDNLPSNKDTTVIVIALHAKHEDTALALLERGANPLQMVHEGQTSPIYHAAYHDMDSFINAVAAHGYQLKDLPVTIWSPLFTAAHNNNIKATQALLAAGVDINSYDRGKGTILSLKFRIGLVNFRFTPKDENYIHMLLDAGADIYARRPEGQLLIDTDKPYIRPILDLHFDKLNRRLVCEPGGGIDPDHLIQDGKPTPELLQYCGAHLLPELFTDHRWKGRGGDGLALFEKIRPLLPDYYKPMLDAIDLTPLRREAAQKETGPAVARYVRRPATPEAER